MKLAAALKLIEQEVSDDNRLQSRFSPEQRSMSPTVLQPILLGKINSTLNPSLASIAVNLDYRKSSNTLNFSQHKSDISVNYGQKKSNISVQSIASHVV